MNDSDIAMCLFYSLSPLLTLYSSKSATVETIDKTLFLPSRNGLSLPQPVSDKIRRCVRDIGRPVGRWCHASAQSRNSPRRVSEKCESSGGGGGCRRTDDDESVGNRMMYKNLCPSPI
ncbi:hypothetical protein GYH30_012650 [Glycine max]|nr:hypothetical protein GYH30_012650 [Glycine max]